MTKFNKNWYADFAEGLNSACVSAVNKDMNREMPVSQNDVYQMAVVLRNYSKRAFKEYLPEIRRAFDEAKYDYVLSYKGELKHRAEVMIKMSPKMQWTIIIACETVGNNKDQFSLCRNMINWYGIERARMKVFKEYIPADNRDRWANEHYDGTTYDEFVTDNVGMRYEDEQAMQSAIENNKWKKELLTP